MSKVSLKECEWCDGSGTDREFLAIGGVRGCWDCQGTGFEGGIEAKKEHLRLQEEEMKQLEKELDL